jgi:hypothetical protein
VKASRGAKWAGVLVALAVPAVCLLAFPGSVVYWGSEARIEHYLREPNTYRFIPGDCTKVVARPWRACRLVRCRYTTAFGLSPN